jgi:hypothetical protein
MSSSARRAGRKHRRDADQVGVVIPSESLRRHIVGRLAHLGYEAHEVGSIGEALDLVEADKIDSLVLHVSAFTATVLSHFGRIMARRRSASVSVVTVADGGQRRATDGLVPLTRVTARSPWRLSTYWVPFSGLSEFSAALTGRNLN